MLRKQRLREIIDRGDSLSRKREAAHRNDARPLNLIKINLILAVRQCSSSRDNLCQLRCNRRLTRLIVRKFQGLQ